MAFDNLKNVWSYPADVDFSNEGTQQWTAVAIGPATNVLGNGIGNAAILAYAAGNNFVGILQNNPEQGEAGAVASNCISQCRALTAWNVGDKLSVGTGGYLQKAGSSDTVFAYAVEAAAIGDISTCKMVNN